MAVNTWLLYFLVNIAGLEPLLAGVVFVAGRVLDAVLDPVMGALSDRLNPRLGRKIFVRWGAVPLGIGFALLWFVPEGGQAVKFVSALGTFALFSVLFTVVQVPYLALTPDLAPSYDERTNLTGFRVGFGIAASLIAFAAPPLVVLVFSSGRELASSDPLGWFVTGLLFGAVASAAYLVMDRSVPEPTRSTPTSATAHASFFSEYRSAFGIYGFKEVFWLFITVTVGTMVLNSVLPFYLESGLKLGAGSQSLVLGTFFGVAILVFPLWNWAAARLGKRGALALGLLITSTAILLLVLFSPPGSVSLTLMSLSALAGVGLSALLLFPWAMLPDVVEFGELHSGRRREGLVYALFTFGQKLAGSLGVFANALVASLFGYVPGAAAQAPATVTALRVMAGPVAAALFLVAIGLTLRFPITRSKHEAVRRQLEQR